MGDNAPDISAAPTLIVGVGASAGGLSAFKELLRAVPRDSGMAFIFVQHLAPQHDSLLAELLIPCTTMPVVPAEHGMQVMREHVYVIQPYTAIAVVAETLQITRPAWHGPRLTVDHLLRSLAALGPNAAGVILSGVGNDGSDGLRRVKAAGGLTIAQNPESADQSGMPQSAIDTGTVDLVLDTQDMGAALARFANLPLDARRVPTAPEHEAVERVDDAEEHASEDIALGSDVLDRMASLLEAESVLDLRVYKRSTLERRVMRRMLLTGIQRLPAYLERLEKEASERQALLADLLISVTDFFRDPEAFGELSETVIAPWARQAGSRETVRCWVAGCATGEEAYSVAIEILDALRGQPNTPRLQIFATDVDQEALAVARAGIYPPAIAQRMSPARLYRYFTRLDGRGYRVRPVLRDSISFAAHDLTNDPPFSRMDLVCCRNVLIYLRRAVQEEILSNFQFALVDRGALFLGSSESVGAQSEGWSPVSKTWRIYRKRSTSGYELIPTIRRRGARPVLPIAAPRLATWKLTKGGALQRAAMLATMPATIIVDDEDAILFTHGDLREFLSFPTGDHPRFELGTTITPSLAGAVRSALGRARREDRPVSMICARAMEGSVRIEASPAEGFERGTLVLTFRVVDDEAVMPPSTDPDASMPAVTELESELRITRFELRRVVEDLEASNEELRASGEEAQSMNEELQSANEELEATTEELRSVNEELCTVNAELREKIALLQRAHDDLSNFFASSNIPIVNLDPDLRIEQFTPAAAKLLDLDHADVGRYIGDFSAEPLRAGLVDEVRAVLADQVPRTREMRLSDGRCFDRRVRPYHSEHRVRGGVVVTLVDVTELQDAAEALRRSEERLRLAQEAADIGIHDFDVRRDSVEWDNEVYRIWGIEPGEPVTYEIFAAGVHPDDRAATNRVVEAAMDPSGDGRYHAEYRVVDRGTGAIRWVLATGQAFFENAQPVRLVGTAQEITQQKEASRSQALLAAIVSSSDDAMLSMDLDGRILSWNQGAARIFGYAESEMIGQSIHRLVPQELHHEETRLLAELRNGRTIDTLETERLTKDGRRVAIAVTMSPLRAHDGEIVGVAKVSRDVTEERRLRRDVERGEERLRLAARAARLGTFDLDLDTDVRIWSEEMGEIFGILDPDIEPDYAFAVEAIHPDDRERVHAARAACFDPAGDGSLECEYRVIRRTDGEARWVLVKAQTHFVGQGSERRPVRSVGVLQDITERKRTEIELSESRDRLSRLFDQAPALIAVHEGPDHVYTYSNPLHDRAVGNRSLIGRPLREAMPELAGQGVFEHFDQVYQSGKPEFTPVIEATFDRRGDGALETSHFAQILQPLFGPDQRVTGVMSFAVDMTETRELRRRAEESEQHFHTLADNIAQLVWIADAEGRIFWYNRRWFEYTGDDPLDASGFEWNRLHHPDHAHRVVAKIERHFATGEPWEDTFPLRGADGRYRWFLSRALPIQDESGRIIRWFGTHTDVTEEREVAIRLREADQRKDEFLAMLGHELRNPLAAVSSAASILEMCKPDDPRLQRVSAVLERQTRHMARLVHGLLEVSRVTRGKIQLDAHRLQLAHVIRASASDAKTRARARGLVLQIEMANEPIWVIGDEVRLTQVLDNLLSNAIKFTDAPGTVVVSVAREAERAVVRVRDTGIGIPEDLMQRIFEPFQQGTQDLARSAGGLGLGLALARGLVELHGGTIAARSAGPGGGSEFTVSLPLAQPPPEDQTRPEPAVAHAYRVLIVEDNEDTAAMLAELLALLGHRVDTVLDGTQALDRLERERPDIVLCDIGLPDMSGYDLAREIRRTPEWGTIPLVAITGYGLPDDRVRAMDAGFDEHLTKPVELAYLQAVLERLS